MAAIQLELKKQNQAQRMMSDQEVTFELENKRLLQENVLLQEASNRLRQEVDDIRQAYANLERKHTMAFYRIHHLRTQLYSYDFYRLVFIIIGIIAILFFICYYGMGAIELPDYPSIEDENRFTLQR